MIKTSMPTTISLYLCTERENCNINSSVHYNLPKLMNHESWQKRWPKDLTFQYSRPATLLKKYSIIGGFL